MSPADGPPPRALVETMLAREGTVPWLARHLARMERSARELALPWPGRDALTAAVADALAGVAGPARVRLVLDAGGPRAEAAPEAPAPWRGVAAVSVPGAWEPGSRRAVHKALPRERWDRAQAAAAAAGAAHALMLDGRGRLGEAALGNVFAVVGGALVTAPVEGLLPGVARGLLLEGMAAREEALEERVWRKAEELFVTNAVRGVVPLARVDGRPVGGGAPGPVAAAAREVLARWPG